MKKNNRDRPAASIISRSFAIALSLAILLAATTGCKFVRMTPLSVGRVVPETEVTDVANLAQVDVFFSASVDRELTRRAFSLLEDGEEMQGIVSWPESDHLAFKPYSSFKRTSTYLIKVTTQAEDTDGNSLEDDFSHTFRSSADTVRPKVTSILPAANSSVALVRPAITVTFSEAMDVTSVINAFSLKPDAGGIFQESADGTTFSYILTEDLEWQARYVVDIGEEAKDLSGNTLGKAEEASFFTGMESVKPWVVSVTDVDTPLSVAREDPTDSVETVTDGVNAKDRIVVRFSEAMDRESVKNGLSFSPTARYTVAWNADGTEITITPDPYFDYGKLLCLTVAKTALDLSGNDLTDSVSYNFRVTGSRSKPPQILAVLFLNGFDGAGNPLSDGLLTLSPMLSFGFAGHYWPDTKPATAPVGFFDVHFEIAEGATINLIEFLSKFSVTCDGASITPFACEIDSNISHMTAVPHDGGFPPSATHHVVRYFAYIDNYSSAYKFVPGLMRLSLSSDFTDSAGNALGEAWSLTANTTN